MKKISALPRIAVPGKLDANEMAGLSKLHTAEENGDEPLITMAVRNGRTIDMPTGELRNAGYDVEQHKSTTTQICRRHYPGELVHLPASEARRLEELGFPDRAEQIRAAAGAQGKRSQRIIGPHEP